MTKRSLGSEDGTELLPVPRFHRAPAPNSAIASTIPAMISNTLIAVSRVIVGPLVHGFSDKPGSQDMDSSFFDCTSQLPRLLMEIPWINEIEQADADGIIPPHGQNSPDIPVF